MNFYKVSLMLTPKLHGIKNIAVIKNYYVWWVAVRDKRGWNEVTHCSRL